jgi:hypothetical protein
MDGAVIVNEAGADVNFRFEGSGNINLLFGDAGNDFVGIRTAAPSGILEVFEDAPNNVVMLSTTRGLAINLTDVNRDVAFEMNQNSTAVTSYAAIYRTQGVATVNHGLYIISQNATALNFALYALNGNGYFADRFGVGKDQPAAKVHIDQTSASGAIPVLFLDQGDVSEQIIKASYSGADVDMIIIELDVDGAPKVGWSETPDVFTLNKGLAVGDGGTTNYANFAGDGELTLFGTARVMRCFHFEPSITRLPGANPPASDEIDNFEFHRYDRGTEESSYIHWEIPHNYAAAGTVHLHFEFLVENPPVGDDEAVVMGVEYKKVSTGDVFDFTGGTASGTVTETIVDGETAYITHMTAEIALTTTGWEPMDVILFRFYRDATNVADTYDNEGAPAANDVWVYSYHLEWLSDKLGTAT